MSHVTIIAELSANHQGRIDQALSLIGAAASAGADIIKLQCYEPDDMVRPNETNTDLAWGGRTLRELYEEGETPRAWMPELLPYIKVRGKRSMVSVFNPDQVGFLEGLPTPPDAYKIASFEAEYADLVREAWSTGRPLYVSLGAIAAHTFDDVLDAAGIDPGVPPPDRLTVLHCTSQYPAPYDTVDLRRIAFLSKALVLPVGYSDHTPSTLVPALAVAAGAVAIEKHLCLDRSTRPLDWEFSLEPDEFAIMVGRVRQTVSMLAHPPGGRPDSTNHLMRGTYLARAVRDGDVFSLADFAYLRPRPVGVLGPLEVHKLVNMDRLVGHWVWGRDVASGEGVRLGDLRRVKHDPPMGPLAL